MLNAKKTTSDKTDTCSSLNGKANGHTDEQTYDDFKRRGIVPLSQMSTDKMIELV